MNTRNSLISQAPNDVPELQTPNNNSASNVNPSAIRRFYNGPFGLSIVLFLLGGIGGAVVAVIVWILGRTIKKWLNYTDDPIKNEAISTDAMVKSVKIIKNACGALMIIGIIILSLTVFVTLIKDPVASILLLIDGSPVGVIVAGVISKKAKEALEGKGAEEQRPELNREAGAVVESGGFSAPSEGHNSGANSEPGAVSNGRQGLGALSIASIVIMVASIAGCTLLHSLLINSLKSINGGGSGFALMIFPMFYVPSAICSVIACILCLSRDKKKAKQKIGTIIVSAILWFFSLSSFLTALSFLIPHSAAG